MIPAIALLGALVATSACESDSAVVGSDEAIVAMGWSPDGSTLALVTVRNVYLIDTAEWTTRLRIPAAAWGGQRALAWIDAETFVLEAEEPGCDRGTFSHCTTDLYLVDASSGSGRFLAGEALVDDGAVAVAPAGDRLAYVTTVDRNRSRSVIALLELDSTRQIVGRSILTPEGGGAYLCAIPLGSGRCPMAPTWSPDGSYVAYRNEDDVEIAAVDGQIVGRFGRDQGVEVAGTQALAWSPRGDVIALSTPIERLPAEVSPPTMSPPCDQVIPVETDLDVAFLVCGFGSTWSPDGRALVFAVWEDAMFHVLVREEGREHSEVPRGDYRALFAWSPDGTKFAIARGEAGCGIVVFGAAEAAQSEREVAC